MIAEAVQIEELPEENSLNSTRCSPTRLVLYYNIIYNNIIYSSIQNPFNVKLQLLASINSSFKSRAIFLRMI